MYDTALLYGGRVGELAVSIAERMGVQPGAHAFATAHRAENTDSEDRWRAITEALARLAREGSPVLWPVHPRVAMK